MAIASPSVPHGETHWLREFYQLECIKKALTDLNNEDICYVSDLDEVWNPEMQIDFNKEGVYKPIQLPYMYYLNLRSDEDWLGWCGTIVTKYKISVKRTTLFTSFITRLARLKI